MKVKANHRHREFARQLGICVEQLTPWEGDVYRTTSLDYPTPNEILSGEGSFRMGGRWNAAGSCKAVYGSTMDVTAVAESRANDAYYGIKKFTKARLLVAIHLRLGRTLDLTDTRVRRKLGVTLREIRDEDWRKVNHGGHESLTQALGRAAAEQGIEALLVPSAAVRNGINVVYFPANRQPASTASVWDAGKLARIRKSPSA